MSLAVDAIADAALVGIRSQGETLGTGFVIDDNGTVLTCHHVIDGLPSVQLLGPDGSTYEVDEDSIAAAPEIDLALISASSPIGTPLPVSGTAIAEKYWTKGYHRQSEAVRDAFPVEGRITGRTSVSYQSYTTAYEIDDVFVLRDDSIEPGLSGAPVLDPEAGVVIAVVSTRLKRDNQDGGFAVPIAYAAAHRALREAVARNQANVPAYGAYLNVPAAQALCQEVTDAEIGNLAQFRNVDLSRHVPRAGIAAAKDQFLSDRAPVFALTGPSGVGKSTELADIAQRLPGRALLLRGLSLQRGSTGGLGEAVRTALSEAAGNRPLPADAEDAVARALSADSGLIVVLDALNEAPLSGREFEEWTAKTLAWLRRTRAQLIVSCRSELWDALVGRPLSAPLDGRKAIVMPLGAFTAEEYQAAATAYGLPPGTDWAILRLPLALRLATAYQQNPAQALGAITSINEVIEAYVREAARKLAVDRTSPLPLQLVLDRLTEVAALMWERETDTVDVKSLSETLADTSIVGALLDDSVMTSAPSGYRFVYDDVSDWLQAQRLDVEHELAAIRHGSWRRVGPIASALREVGRHGSDVLCGHLTWLLEDPGDDSDPEDDSNLAFRLAAATLAKVADGTPYRGVLDRMAEMTVAAEGSFDFYFLSLEPMEFWRSIPLPLAQRLDLLRVLCRAENYYRWRAKDWTGWGNWADSREARDNYAMLAYHLLRQEPAAGIPALVPWLDDTTALAGDWDSAPAGSSILGRGEATVADVAMAILYQLRNEQGSMVWEAMVKAPEQCSVLIYQLADEDPEFLVHMMETGPKTESSDRLVTKAAEAIVTVYERWGAVPPAEMMQALYHAVSSRYSRGLGQESLGSALNILIKGPDAQRYVEALVSAYRAKVPGVSAHSLVVAASHDSSLVIPVLAAALAGSGGTKQDALWALEHSSDPEVRALGDQIVRYYLEHEDGTIDRDVSRYAERRLAKEDDLGADALYVIQRVIDAPAGSGRYVLAYTLTKSPEHGDPGQRLALLRKFVDATTDDDSAIATAESLISSMVAEDSPPGAFGLLKQLLDGLESSKADRLLIRQAFRKKPFADVLAGWLTTEQLSAPGDRTRQFQARIESGESPATAVREVVLQERR